MIEFCGNCKVGAETHDIYKEKEKIINRVVERATIEIVKKGLPKLLESLGKEI